MADELSAMGSMQGEVAAACILPAIWGHRPPCSNVATARGGWPARTVTALKASAVRTGQQGTQQGTGRSGERVSGLALGALTSGSWPPLLTAVPSLSGSGSSRFLMPLQAQVWSWRPTVAVPWGAVLRCAFLHTSVNSSFIKLHSYYPN